MKGLAAVGDVLAGKYRVDKILGIGGMGMVVAATHLEIDQRVALKFMLPANESAESSARFLREARAAGRLNSDHVCRVMDVGRFDTGQPYIVMEYLQGENLGALLRRRGPLRVSEAVDYILQAIEGLAEAHAHGIIHRDLKPDNLFLHKRNDGGFVVKVLDFGISKIAVTGMATKTGDIMGSPAYMAPEQMESSRSVDHRADVWSLGVVLYQLVVGKAPFQGESLPLLCMAVVNDDPVPMTAVREDLPDGFEAAVMRCLRKEPGERYADVGELAEALAPFGPKHATTSASRIQIVLRRAANKHSSANISTEFSTVAPTIDHPPSREPMHSTTLGGTSGQSISTMRTERSRGLIAGVIIALGLAAVAVGVLWPHGGTQVRETAAPMPAVAPPAPRPIVEPIEEPPTAAKAEVPPQADPAVVAVDPPRVEEKVAPAPKKPPIRKQGRKKPTRPAAGSGSAKGSDAAPEDVDQWDHMTHDEKEP